jgi:hypothetical protein
MTLDTTTLLCLDAPAIAAKQNEIRVHQDTLADPNSDDDARADAHVAILTLTAELAALLLPTMAPFMSNPTSSSGPPTPVLPSASTSPIPNRNIGSNLSNSAGHTPNTPAPKTTSTPGSGGTYHEFSETEMNDLMTSPTYGGLFKDSAGRLIPFTGSDPDTKVNIFSFVPTTSKWVCATYDPTRIDQKGPSHPGQFRPTDLKALQKTAYRCSNLDNPVVYNGLATSTADVTYTPHRVYLQVLRQKVIESGMYDEFLIPDVANPGGWDIFLKPGRFTVDQVKAYIVQQRETCDVFRANNYNWSGRLVMSTLHPDLLRKVIASVGINASGPESFISAIKEAFTGDHYEQLEQLKITLKEMKLSSYPGENIQLANEAIRDIMLRLDNSDMLNIGDDLLIHIVGVYEQSSSRHFELWATSLYNTVKAFIEKCRFADAATKANIPNPITYDDLVNQSNAKYLELVGSGRYPAAITKTTPTSDGPLAMVAASITALKKEVKQLKKEKSKPSSTTDPSKDKDKKQAPKSNKDVTGGIGGRTSDKRGWPPKGFPTGPREWVHFFPAQWNKSTSVLKRGNKRYLWCSLCFDGKGGWCYHRDDGHAAWLARRAAVSTTAAPAATSAPASSRTVTPQATLALLEADDSDSSDDGVWYPVI